MTIAGNAGIEDFFAINIQETLQGHHTFNVSLPLHVIEGESQTMEKSHELIGENFLVELTDRRDLKYKFEGIITNINFTKSAPHQMSLNISGMSPTILLDDHEIAKSFTEMKLGDIVNEVVKNYSIKSNCIVSPLFKDKIDYCVQYRETPYQFIRRLASEYGEWLYYNGTKLVFGELKSDATEQVVLGDGLHTYGFNMNAVPLKDAGSVYDYMKDEIYTSKSQHDKIKSLDPFSQKVFDNSVKLFGQEGNDIFDPNYRTKKQLETQQELFKAGLVSGMQTLSGSSSYHTLHVGTTIDVVGTEMVKAGSMSQAVQFNVGKYTITGISHHITREGDYQNTFSAIPDKLVHPPADMKSMRPRASKQVAEVVDNKDSDNIGRIQVRFPWMESSEKTPWIRVVTAHAFKDRGMYFIPEIGDSVLVDFENGDPDCPIVTGSLYHGKAKPAKWYDDSNNLKAIMTKSGNELLFNDESGKETIKIFNKDEQNMITLTLDESKRIKIESTGYIEIHADKDITMKANNIKMSANKKLSISCNDMETSAANNITTDAGNNYELNAGMDAAVSAGNNYELAAGMNAEVSAGMNYKCSGGTAAEMTGLNTKVEGSAMLDLKAGAMANLKGALVKIN